MVFREWRQRENLSDYRFEKNFYLNFLHSFNLFYFNLSGASGKAGQQDGF